MQSLPDSITFIGAGIISIEFASIMIKSGVEVNVVHHTNHALEGFNESHVNKLIQKLKDEGVKFYFSENTKSVKPNAQRFIVETESGKMIETDYVLDATGRKPNVQQIGLEKWVYYLVIEVLRLTII